MAGSSHTASSRRSQTTNASKSIARASLEGLPAELISLIVARLKKPDLISLAASSLCSHLPGATFRADFISPSLCSFNQHIHSVRSNSPVSIFALIEIMYRLNLR
jgi:hypothetical protein